MLVDWFTIAAQIVNFLILVWLLNRFLYKPILDAIDAREKRIADELAAAAAKQAEAETERAEFQRKNVEFDRQRAALMNQAANEAQAERTRLFDAARNAAADLANKRVEALRSDAAMLNGEIRRRTQQETFAIARKALADLATVSLEERLADVFVRRLRDLDPHTKTLLSDALASNAGPALVRSAFDLPEAQRALVTAALNEVFSADLHVRFETAPDLVGGIEFTANGYNVAWSIGDYLTSLEKRVGELLNERPEPTAVSDRRATANPT